MRTQQLLDDLQALVERSGRLPGLGRKAVDERRFYSLLGQLREALPADLREAKRITQERDGILSQANAQAEEVLAQAQQKAAAFVEESEIIRRAGEEAKEILRRGEAQAQEIRQQANAYAAQVLERLDTMVSRIAAAVEDGRGALSETVHSES